MKKAQALLAVLLIFILAGCEKTEVINPQVKDQASQTQTKKIDTESSGINTDDRKPEEKEIAIEKIDRRKGEDCIVGGPDERYKNLPPANESYIYADPFNSISLNIPYNKKWKLKGCEIGAFTQFKDGDGVLVYYGQPNSWGPDQYSLRIGKVRSIESIQEELGAGGISIPKQQMRKIAVNGLEAFRWQENGMGKMIRIEIVGKKYNYRFESAIQDENKLIKIIESMKLK